MNTNQQKLPAVSVVVPVYNVEKYLAPCLESILSQSFGDFEIIVVEDCSTDDSLRIAKKFAAAGERITLVRQRENMGLSAARNRGIDLARGKYVTFIDSDDWLGEDFFADLVQAAEATDAQIVSMGYTEYGAEESGGGKPRERKIPLTVRPIRLSPNVTDRLRMMIDMKLSAIACAKLFRRDFLLRHGLRFEKIKSEDILFHFAALYHAENYVVIPQTSYFYRQTASSITRGANLDKAKQAVETVFLMLGFADEYMRSMPEIIETPTLAHRIKKFFVWVLMNSFFLNVAGGVSFREILDGVDEVFAKYAPENAALLSFLFEEYLGQYKVTIKK